MNKTERIPKFWDIKWDHRYMDEDDVDLEHAAGNTEAKVGDILWSVPKAIGPISVTKTRGIGAHLECDTENAYLISAAPALLEAVKRLLESNDAQSRFYARVAIFHATGEVSEMQTAALAS